MPVPAPPAALSPAQTRAVSALREKRWFKWIGGGSLTDPGVLEPLAFAYAMAGADCLDVAPDPAVLQAVDRALARLPSALPRPLLMVSLPLDPDPHFQKIDLLADACTGCGACVPVCPTEALALPNTAAPALPLLIDQPLCYGCGRCVTACPTEALALLPFLQVAETLVPALSWPGVEAVEIHTRYADPVMVPPFLDAFAPLLEGKLLSLCFRPQVLPAGQWQEFVQAFLTRFSPAPLIIQVDGEPMSGTDEPEASRPALEAARTLLPQLPDGCLLTISGGINRHTAAYLRQPQYAALAGVGMGTVARRALWPLLQGPPAETVFAARALLQPFQNRSGS